MQHQIKNGWASTGLLRHIVPRLKYFRSYSLFILKQKFALFIMWDNEQHWKGRERSVGLYPKAYIHSIWQSEWSCHTEAILTSDRHWWVEEKQQKKCSQKHRHDSVVFLRAAPLLAIFNQALTRRGIFNVSLKWSCYICLRPTHVLSAANKGERWPPFPWGVGKEWLKKTWKETNQGVVQTSLTSKKWHYWNNRNRINWLQDWKRYSIDKYFS